MEKSFEEWKSHVLDICQDTKNDKEKTWALGFVAGLCAANAITDDEEVDLVDTIELIYS